MTSVKAVFKVVIPCDKCCVVPRICVHVWSRQCYLAGAKLGEISWICKLCWPNSSQPKLWWRKLFFVFGSATWCSLCHNWYEEALTIVSGSDSQRKIDKGLCQWILMASFLHQFEMLLISFRIHWQVYFTSSWPSSGLHLTCFEWVLDFLRLVNAKPLWEDWSPVDTGPSPALFWGDFAAEKLMVNFIHQRAPKIELASLILLR